ncbi:MULTISPECIES: TolC family protein [unclassified Psychrobacter]|uniref:TolC family protein n=1 Tax=unclassified Psychrobacter TaxID=196806 RepID=UPI0025B4BE3A|nr:MULTISPECIES: TolC family protein [unclassified Psychrobacter]MDN3454432.1 TolC family protein [Psychrobacter sp. APC 3350]MDN3503534.1 TolC family protein [Psychrobacter sp. 5A.1]
MKFTLSALPTAMLTVAAMSVPVMTYASTDADSIQTQDDVTPITVTQIMGATNQINRNETAVAPSHTLADTDNVEQRALSTLIDPITHKSVDNSYPLEVSSFLSLEQAQKLLVQVSPKIAANQAAIAASDYQTDALKTIDNPLIFARVTASTYRLDADVDLSSLRNGVVNDVNSSVDSIDPPIPDLPDFGKLVGERIPDSYELKRSGSTTGAGLGVVWPIYTAGRTEALTGASDARTQEAVADSILDKNELYNTLIERYFKAQLAIIAAYLRDDAYDTLQQTDHMAERLFEEGFISRVDRLEAQSALADAKSESVNANNDARLAMISLQRLLRTDYRIKPTTPLFVSSRPLPDVSYFQNLALSNHPGLQKVAAKRAQAQQLHALSDTGYKPTVLLYGYGQLEKDPSWFAGISASWKLWGGLDKTASLASSNAKIRQADLSEIEVSDNLLLLVEKNWHDVNNAQSRYQALQSNVDLAAEVLRLRRLGLQEGVNTTVDVVQAQTQSLKARTEQAQAANSYVQSLAALMQSCGTPLAFNAYLNAADIQLPTLYNE